MATSRLSGTKKILAVLLDVTGVLYESGEGDGKAIKGSMEAVSRLRAAGFPLLFCTNETQITTGALVQRLQRLGFELREEEVHSPVLACRQFLQENGLRPHLIVHPSALPDYDGIATSDPNAVVLGDAAGAFTYDTLNRAFRILIEQPGSTLISLGQGRYYREGDALAMDVGPFMKALEYATNMEAKVIGKPSQEFFLSAVKQLGVPPENAMMVGDDVVNDVGGAQSCGLFGVLVKTGKYRLGDENHPTVKPNRIVANLSEAVELLLQQR